MGKLKNLAKDGYKKHEQMKKIEEKVEKVKALYQTAKNLYHYETRATELIKLGYARLQNFASVCPGANLYLKLHEEHINRLGQAMQAAREHEMAIKSFRQAIAFAKDLDKKRRQLRLKHGYVHEMINGDDVISDRAQKIEEFRDYYTYTDHQWEWLQVCVVDKPNWHPEDVEYNQAACDIYVYEKGARRRVAGEKIISVAGDVTAAYFAFARDYHRLRENARAVSTKLKKLLDGTSSGWRNMDKVAGHAAVKKLMLEAFGADDRKTYEAVRHFAWGDPLKSGAVSDAAHATREMGRLAQAWLKWVRSVSSGQHMERF